MGAENASKIMSKVFKASVPKIQFIVWIINSVLRLVIYYVGEPVGEMTGEKTYHCEHHFDLSIYDDTLFVAKHNHRSLQCYQLNFDQE